MVQVKKEEYVNVPDNWYLLEVADVKEADGKYGKFLSWVFKIVGGDFNDATVTGMTPMKLAPGTKLDTWSQACGKEVEVGEIFNTDELVGRRPMGLVETVKDGDKTYSNVIKLKKASETAPASKPPAKEKASTPPSTEKPAPAKESAAPKSEKPPAASGADFQFTDKDFDQF